jgi:Phage major capsid protein E
MDLNQAAFGVTQSVIDNFTDQKEPNLGLSAFFPALTYPGFEVSYKARRARMLVAKDVLRATQSNMNTFNNYTQKIFKNPFFSEAFNFTSTDIYKVTFGMGVAPQGPQANGLIDATVEYLEECKNKIKRATEQYRASALQTGTITTIYGDSVDFKRQAASMVVLSAINANRTWVSANLTGATPTATPLEDLGAAADFIRKQGLSIGNEYDVIMGATAFSNFVLSTRVQTERQIFSQFRLADIQRPVLNEVTGMAFHGRVSSGYANFNIWTYIDFYEQDNGTKTDYIAPTNVIVIPQDFVANTTFAGLPTVMGNSFTGQYIAPMEGEFMIYDMIDPVKKSWEFHIDSAPLPLIKSVDRVFTYTTS